MVCPGLLDAVRAGGVRLANAHGTGRARGPCARRVLGRRRRLDRRSAPALRRRRAAAPALGRAATADRVRDWRRASSAQQVVYRPVVLRLQLVASDRKIEVMQGASARVLNLGDDPNVPTAATAKDVWVIGGTVAPPLLSRASTAAAGRPDRVRADPGRRGVVLGRACAGACRARRPLARGGARTHDRRDRHRHRRTVGRPVERDAHGDRRAAEGHGAIGRRADGHAERSDRADADRPRPAARLGARRGLVGAGSSSPRARAVRSPASPRREPRSSDCSRTTR